MSVFFSSVAEFNTFITMLGCLFATVQATTGIYAAYLKKKIYLIKQNEVLFRSHRAFGGFATVMYFVGLYAGLSGLIGGFLTGEPPLEFSSISYNIHVWPSFIVLGILVLKTYFSYFNKRRVYKTAKWLGIATFIAWAYTWITAAISFYLRALPVGDQHEPMNVLLPHNLLWLQLLLPFLIGIIISIPILWKANRLELKKNPP
jgi:hypothetical protein